MATDFISSLLLLFGTDISKIKTKEGRLPWCKTVLKFVLLDDRVFNPHVWSARLALYQTKVSQVKNNRTHTHDTYVHIHTTIYIYRYIYKVWENDLLDLKLLLRKRQ